MWTWTIGGDAQAVSVAVEAASAPPVPTPGVLHGGSVGRIVVLRALQPGEESLHFVLACPTKHSNPLASFTVKVAVSAAAVGLGLLVTRNAEHFAIAQCIRSARRDGCFVVSVPASLST